SPAATPALRGGLKAMVTVSNASGKMRDVPSGISTHDGSIPDTCNRYSSTMRLVLYTVQRVVTAPPGFAASVVSLNSRRSPLAMNRPLAEDRAGSTRPVSSDDSRAGVARGSNPGLIPISILKDAKHGGAFQPVSTGLGKDQIALGATL